MSGVAPVRRSRVASRLASSTTAGWARESRPSRATAMPRMARSVLSKGLGRPRRSTVRSRAWSPMACRTTSSGGIQSLALRGPPGVRTLRMSSWASSGSGGTRPTWPRGRVPRSLVQQPSAALSVVRSSWTGVAPIAALVRERPAAVNLRWPARRSRSSSSPTAWLTATNGVSRGTSRRGSPWARQRATSVSGTASWTGVTPKPSAVTCAETRAVTYRSSASGSVGRLVPAVRRSSPPLR